MKTSTPHLATCPNKTSLPHALNIEQKEIQAQPKQLARHLPVRLCADAGTAEWQALTLLVAQPCFVTCHRRSMYQAGMLATPIITGGWGWGSSQEDCKYCNFGIPEVCRHTNMEEISRKFTSAPAEEVRGSHEDPLFTLLIIHTPPVRVCLWTN